MVGMTHVQVHDAEQLLEVFDRRPVPPLKLRSPLLDAAEASRWEGRLNGLLDDCGCEGGTVGFLSGLAVSLVLVHWGHTVQFSPVTAAGILLSGVTTGAIGKLLGQRSSRRRARRDALKLVGMLAALESVPDSRVKGSTS
jgi:hypothetical protein